MIKRFKDFRVWVDVDTQREYVLLNRVITNYEKLKVKPKGVIFYCEDRQEGEYFEFDLNDAGRKMVEHWIEELNNYIQKESEE